MSITYPLAADAFWEQLRFASRPPFKFLPNQKQSQDGGGNVLGASLSAPKWSIDVELAGGWHDANLTSEADLTHLLGRFGTFLAYDIRRPFPASDPLGAHLDQGSLVAIGGEAAYGDVSLGTYRYEGSTVTLTQAASVVGDAGTYFDIDGVLQTSAVNTLRVDYGPFPNYVQNFKAAGAVAGTPGTAPTNWSIVAASGISRQIVGSGVQDGIAYVDVRWFGTASVATSWVSYFQSGGTVLSAQSQAWILSVHLALIGGSVPSDCSLGMDELNSSNVFVAGGSVAHTITAALVRKTYPRTLTAATGVSIRPYIVGQIANGQVVDFTLRIGVPLLNRGAVALTYPRVPLGIAVETAFTQRLIRNREFTNAAWSRTRVGTPTLASVTDPWGGAAAYKIPEDATAGNTHIIYQAYTTTNYVNHVAYCFAKAAERTKIQLQMSNFSTTNCSAIFDLVAGTVSSVTSGTGDFTGASARIVDLGNGWFWCEIEALKVTGDTDCNAVVLLCDASGAISYNGDGTSGIYLAFADLEEGTTGHMPLVTTTMAVARAADVPTFKGKGVNDWVIHNDIGGIGTVLDVSGNLSFPATALSRPWVKDWLATRDTQPSAAAVQIKSKGSNNRSIALKGLPPFYIITKGDKISVAYSSTKIFYCEAMETIVADYLGETAEFEVQPFLPAGLAVNDAVTLKKAPCKFRPVAGSFRVTAGQGNISAGASFSAVSAP